MNKKKIGVLFVLGFLLLNFFSIYNFVNNYLGKNYFKSKDYENALKYFEKNSNKEGIYNQANSLYNFQKYKESLEKYLLILTDEKNKLNYFINHNIGNTYYKIGEKNDINDEKIKNWENSISFYKNALEIEENEETRKNLEFVESKLEDLEKEKDNTSSQNQDSSSENSVQPSSSENSVQPSSSKTSPQPSPLEEREQENEENISSSNSSLAGGGDDSSESEGLDKGEEKENGISEEQQAEIEKYEQYLKDSQENNGNYFNKIYEENNNRDDVFDMFFNDPFFNNDLLNENSDKKDW